MITKVRFKKFTAFEKLEIYCSPGINIFIGKNGTGKTHILKAVYVACEITKSKRSFTEKIRKVFLPSNGEIGRLVKRSSASTTGFVELYRCLPEDEEETKVRISITKAFKKTKTSGSPKVWRDTELNSVYIPVKEMLSNAPGFRSLYNMREIHFEEVFYDILDWAFLDPTLKLDKNMSKLSNIIQKKMGGLRNKHGEMEFTLLAEGIRKLGLLWLLIQNGAFSKNSILFWDEPEANLNPKLVKTLVEIILELQRMGVQVFLATHSYITLKEFDLQMKKDDKVIFHYLEISPNAIDETFADLVDRDIERSMGGLGN